MRRCKDMFGQRLHTGDLNFGRVTLPVSGLSRTSPAWFDNSIGGSGMKEEHRQESDTGRGRKEKWSGREEERRQQYNETTHTGLYTQNQDSWNSKFNKAAFGSLKRSQSEKAMLVNKMYNTRSKCSQLLAANLLIVSGVHPDRKGPQTGKSRYRAHLRE